jgi:hypothetical protein
MAWSGLVKSGQVWCGLVKPRQKKIKTAGARLVRHK